MTRPNHSVRRNAVLEVLQGIANLFVWDPPGLHRYRAFYLRRGNMIRRILPAWRVYIGGKKGDNSYAVITDQPITEYLPATEIGAYPTVNYRPRVCAYRLTTAEKIKRYYDLVEDAILAQIDVTVSSVSVEPSRLLLDLRL
jgi:hypothetical protein